MSSTTSASTTTPPLMRSPERTAWGVLLVAFSVFCLICMGSVIAVHTFFFLSTVPMDAKVYAVRGALGLTPLDLREIPVRDQSDLSIGNIVRPNPQSQALIVFRDPYLPERVLAMITLDESSSAVKLQLAVRPRFDWGNAAYEIDLTQVEGVVDVYVPSGLTSNLIIYLQTTQGAQVRLAGSGEYNIRVFEGLVRATNIQGEMVLVDTRLAVDRQAKGIPVGFEGVVQTGNSEIVAAESPYRDLLANSRLQQQSDTGFPLIWRCGNEPGSIPSGQFQAGVESGRPAMFIVRTGAEEPNPHGETFCWQGTDLDARGNPTDGEEGSRLWLDVSMYDYLELKTTFFINYQSLNRCGQEGSECPLMIRIDYMGTDGQPYQLFYGFYAVNNPQFNDPLRCQSCFQEHILVREKSWYTYRTGNLVTILQPDQRPQYITRVRFYASGHRYDMRISELSLVGAHQDQITALTTASGS